MSAFNAVSYDDDFNVDVARTAEAYRMMKDHRPLNFALTAQGGLSVGNFNSHRGGEAGFRCYLAALLIRKLTKSDEQRRGSANFR